MDDLDLNKLLKDWPHEPGQISVRKIMGMDGKEKLQLRLDLGLIQMEMIGRPDGQKPHGFDSLLAYHKHRARKKSQEGQEYKLSAEECADLQQEGIQYYHRYVSLFQISDFNGVVRDTQRNLDLFNFVTEHVDAEELAWPLEQFRPYVTMMNTRAKAAIELERGDFDAALRQIERGRRKIVQFYEKTNPEMEAKSPELAFLDEWLEEVRAKRPLTKLERLERELRGAVAEEAYERAAEIRDAIEVHKRKKAMRGEA